MAKYNIEIQNDGGDIYYPHTAAEVVFDNEGASIKDKISIIFKSIFKTPPVSDLINKNTTYFYDLYTRIINKHPHLLSQKVLGKDQSNTLDIKQITYTPSAGYKNTILITAGVHGDEKAYPYLIYELLKLLTLDANYSFHLKKLKEETRIIIIPIANPWGINNKKRQNSRNVDINRNFDHKWSTQPAECNNASGTRYKGTAPFSEKESQYIKQVMEINYIDSHIDLHNFLNTDSRGYVMYYSKATENISIEIVKNMIKDKNETVEYYVQGDDSCAANYAESVHKLPSMTLEAVRSSGNIDTVENINKAFNLLINHLIQYGNINRNSKVEVGGIILDRIDNEYGSSSSVQFPKSTSNQPMTTWDKTLRFSSDGLLMINGFITASNQNNDGGVPNGSTSLDPRITHKGETTNRLSATYGWGLAFNLPIAMQVKVSAGNDVRFQLYGCYDGTDGVSYIKRVKVNFTFIPTK
ncbi:MAG: M14 family metallopeptidase [Clostridium sp.]